MSDLAAMNTLHPQPCGLAAERATPTGRTCIATWLVLDGEEDATEFPSVGATSASRRFQEVYWRCVALFFLTSRVHNPSQAHVFFSNVDPAQHAPPDVLDALDKLEVEHTCLPIRHRLPAGTVRRWGNQFYVLDVIGQFAHQERFDGLVLADSDCIWRKPVESFEASLYQHSCLLYTLAPGDQKNYEVGRLLNGMSHARMTEIARDLLALPEERRVEYHGGELFAATRAYCRRIEPYVTQLWARTCAEAGFPDSVKEEAHFLSIIADGLGVKNRTANGVIRRMWTNFEDVNTSAADEDLTLWHLPAEKKFGFKRLWHQLGGQCAGWRSIEPDDLNRLTARSMGVPRRSAHKAVLDLRDKVLARFGFSIL